MANMRTTASHDAHYSDDYVAAHHQVPVPVVRLCLHRLRYVARVLVSAPDIVIALIRASFQANMSWGNLMLSDFRWMHGFVCSELQLPWPDIRLDDWTAYICASPKCWNGLLKCVVKSLLFFMPINTSRTCGIK